MNEAFERAIVCVLYVLIFLFYLWSKMRSERWKLCVNSICDEKLIDTWSAARYLSHCWELFVDKY